MEIIWIVFAFLQVSRVSLASSQGTPTCLDDFIIPREFLADKPRCNQFKNAFLEEVRSSNILSEFFDFSQISAQQFGRKMEPYVSSVFKTYNIPNPVQLAHSCVDAISHCHKPLEMPVIARVYGSTMAKIAFLGGVLDEDNAVSMALTFANSFRESVKQYESSDPDWKLKALIKGCLDFLDTVHLTVKEFGHLSVLIYANEWKLVESS
ncbi:hypothetical protein TNIN_496251 [Trichonephila inaurata madagascariensis]|uniref:Uncharacterized protein n=1 Tax=Trichonephila inaurata madagascariensis TaxID=2747483 RepID=A0A8X6YYG8_9ARAC|nr:hypothetical protein TNIN_496251 [Trichonephila inaurata madagascariensis]